MSGKPRKFTGYSLAAIFVLLGMTACAEHEAQVFFVSGNQVVNEQNQCQLLVGGGQVLIRPFGYLDLSIANNYLLFPSFSTGLPESTSIHGNEASELMLNNNVIRIKGARVNYDFPPANALGFNEADFITLQSLQNQFVFTTGSLQEGEDALGAIEAITPIIGSLLANAPALQDRYSSAQIVARLTFEGELLDGTIVFSNEFAYPITLCNGCLVYFPVTNCTDLNPEPEIPIPCFPGQDDGVDCRLCYVLAATPEEALDCLPPEIL